jgi:hypothetical protein
MADLELTSLDQLLFTLKMSFTLATQQATLPRRSTVLSLPLLLVLPGCKIDTWQLILDGVNFFQLLLVLHDEDVGAAVLGDVLAGLRRVRRVDTGGDAAGEDGAQIRQKPLRRVETENPDAVVALQAELDERLGDDAGFWKRRLTLMAGNTKGGSINVPLTSCLTGLDESVLQIKTKIVSCYTDNSKQGSNWRSMVQ